MKQTVDFSALNKNAAKSFNQQKALIKKVLSGRSVQCETCHSVLRVVPKSTGLSISCEKGCTDIDLEANLTK